MCGERNFKCRKCQINKIQSEFYESYLKTYNYICIECQKEKSKTKKKNYRICPVCQNKFCVFGPVKECSIKCRIINNSTKDENGCWNWNLSNYNDFPQVIINMKKKLVHHLAYGEFISTPGKFDVIHRKCGNKKCVNPFHLSLEKLSKVAKRSKMIGNSQAGENNWQAKLCEKDIRDIVDLRKEGEKFREIANKFGISVSHSSSIFRKVWWKHLYVNSKEFKE
jgi:DNA-directed RNA polymerase subunit RPC12/RpoP